MVGIRSQRTYQIEHNGVNVGLTAPEGLGAAELAELVDIPGLGDAAWDEAIANARDVRTRFAAHALRGKSPAEIYALVQGRIDGWGTLAAAKSDLRDWLPLLFAAVAWMVMEREG